MRFPVVPASTQGVLSHCCEAEYKGVEPSHLKILLSAPTTVLFDEKPRSYYSPEMQRNDKDALSSRDIIQW